MYCSSHSIQMSTDIQPSSLYQVKQEAIVALVCGDGADVSDGLRCSAILAFKDKKSQEVVQRIKAL